ncbi:UvrD-helicase domain-containing protein [bacterium]|nr:UvrD-helicase domain-containing protein [bacterium]
MSGRRWTAAQLEAINARDCELAVSAAAGSGKTSVLVERVLRCALGQQLDAQGLARDSAALAIPLDRLLIATFTNAAAAELRSRLHEQLGRELQRRVEAGQPTRLLREQLALLPLASIGTLHGFCLELIRRYGHEQGLASSRVLSEHESRLLLHEQASRFLDEKLGSGQEELLRLGLDWGGQDGVGAEDLSRSSAGRGLRPLLLMVYELRRSLPDHEAWYSQHLGWADLDPQNCDPGHPLLAAQIEELRAWRDRWIASDAAFGLSLGSELPDAGFLQTIAARRLALQDLRLDLHWDKLGIHLDESLRKTRLDLPHKPALTEGYRRDIDKESPWYERIPQYNSAFAEEIKDWQEHFSRRPFAQVAADENHVRGQISLLWSLAADFEQRISAYKRERGWLDYSDMERGALELLSARDEAGRPLRDESGGLRPSSVALELRSRYLAVLVDEYQDTSPLQAALLELVCPELPLPDGSGSFRPRFVVGDVKQSIYSFRLAEPELFIRLQARLRSAEMAGQRLVLLRENFRSRRGVVAGINRLLGGLMSLELGGEDYAEAALIYSAGYEAFESEAQTAARQAEPALRISLVPEPEPSPSEDALPERESSMEEPATEEEGPGGGEDEDSPELQRSVYRAVARRLLELKAEADGGHLTVLDHAIGALRPAQWGDMVILLRSTRGRVETLREELERAGVPCLALGRSGFYERPEVLDALSLLKVLDNPLQDTALAALLRGPALGLSAQELLQVARPDIFAAQDEGADAGPLPTSREPLWLRLRYSAARHPDGGLRARLLLFIARLEHWRDLARDEPLNLLLHRLYREAGLLAAAAAQDRAQQRRANLEELLRLAGEFSSFERQGISRFLQFIESSRRAAGDTGEAVLGESGQQQVRILTVHQSKGLEFPIVLLPDLQRRFNQQDLGRDLLWHPRAGLGGRFYDYQARPPRRAVTLQLEQVRRAKRADLLSEELRLLYVALTRARERLELISGLPRSFKAEKAVAARPQEARSWLDWLALQLGPQLLQCLEEGSAELAEAQARISLQLMLPGGAAAAEHDGGAAQEQDPLAAALLRDQGRGMLRLLEAAGAQSAQQRLPGKLSVSHIAHQPPAQSGPDAPDSEFVLEGFEQPAIELRDYQPPRLLSSSEADTEEAVLAGPDPRALGTATHRLLQELDPAAPGFARYAVREELAGLRDALLQRGLLDPLAASALRLDRIAALVTELQPRARALLAEGGQAWRELPIGLLVPEAELARLPAFSAGQAADSAYGSGSVYVQGTIDLLLAGRTEALIVDYKTDRGASAETLLARYSQQLEWYARAVRLLLPSHSVRWAIYGLDRAGLVLPDIA